ncbi:MULTISPECIES: hypothetical protein [unclassified Lysobacter]|uniref:hypothetical protein n=1 Tax=unclassified Lysobacter TaxID=2635362 RepID=UPI0006FDABB3|nr:MULTISPECIES: hypothetical protein [unclassified Lysobacter]KRA76021.1 hypothetical protein ASD78_08755 [Lysobacter sp. Root667]KRC36815.1 hypothetical protein ASE10_06900 [Lysobacter sp. Root76]KRD66911.1 hypothetical protein ASE45_16555 [Lysobacter sp. Root96]
MNVPDTDANVSRKRNRGMLIVIFALFFGSMLVAGVLRFSGWRPHGMKNHGELLQPPSDLRRVVPRLADGKAYEWRPAERMWRIALAPPADCTTECAKLARDLDTVWQLFGKDADQVHVLWIGQPPAGAPHPAALRIVQSTPQLRAGLPRVDDPKGVPVYVIDPNGFVILRYAPGFDPADLREDLSRLLKLM